MLRRRPETGEKAWDLLQWGLIPHWARDRASPQLHARSETAHELPSFRGPFARRRCLVAADRFVEFRTIGRPKGQEVAFGLVTGRSFAVAAIWDTWRNPETDEWLQTFAEWTVDAKDFIGEMHDRMPAILPPEAWPVWLGDTPALVGVARPAATVPARSADVLVGYREAAAGWAAAQAERHATAATGEFEAAAAGLHSIAPEGDTP